MISTPLRPYQARAVAAVRAHWARGTRAVCVVAPTGAGKTVIAAALAPALALVHTRTLRDQSAARIPGARVLTIQAALRAGAPIALPHGAVVFIDECHHIVGAQWRRVLALLPASARIVGMTATPERADGTALGDVFGALVTTETYQNLLRAGYLAPCRTVAARAGTDPATAYLQFGCGRPGLIFGSTIAECNAAVAALHTAGIRAAAITADTAPAHREWAVAAYARGEISVLASPMALSEGFDAPNAAVCILARRCDHVSTYLQIVNRVTRPHPSKDPARGGTPAVVVDLTGAAARHGHPLEDRQYALTGRGISRAPARPVAVPSRRGAAVAPAARAGAVVGRWATAAWAWLAPVLRAA